MKVFFYTATTMYHDMVLKDTMQQLLYHHCLYFGATLTIGEYVMP